MDWKMARWLAGSLLVTLAGNTSPLQAKSLEIQFSGLDLVYDGTNIYDARTVLGGRGDTGKADPLASVTFLVDGVVRGTLATDVWADVFIAGVTNIPVGGGTVTSAGNEDTFGFDIHTSADGWGLGLNLETAQIFYTGGNIAIGGGAAASSVAIQSLPFGLHFDDDDTISIAFSSGNLRGLTDNGLFLTGFRASGTGSISGMTDGGTMTPPVPEPASALMLLIGALGFIGYRRVVRSS